MSKANYGPVGSRGLVNLNGHVMCAVDTETTGLVAGHNDIIEVAVVPLDAALEPMSGVIPFVTLLKPKDRQPDSWTEEAARVHRITKEMLLVNGVDPWRAAELFEKWMERLHLAPGKKIAPLAWNWRFDAGFIEDWLGPKTYNDFFWNRARDGMPVVQYFNDRAEFEGRKPAFPQTSLQEVRARFGIPQSEAHRALGDALTTAKVYRKLIDFQVDLLPSTGSTDRSI